MTRDYADTVFNAERVEELDEIVAELDELPQTSWEVLGFSNNVGVVNAQQAHPVVALCELVTNSEDAILKEEFRKQYPNEYLRIKQEGDDYEPEHGLKTYRDAAAELLDENYNDHEIEVRATGDSKKDPVNLVFADDGEGKPPQDVENTFLDVGDPGAVKQLFDFLQGQFGMGGLAVIPHCGNRKDRTYQFIATAGMNQPKQWTWTIIRFNEDDYCYEYLTWNGSPPTFAGNFDGKESGSVLKLYEYQLPNKGQITSHLRYDLDRILWDLPVPVTYVEERPYKSKVMELTSEGAQQELRNSSAVQESFTIQHDFGEIGYLDLGEQDIHTFLFDQDSDSDDARIALSSRQQDHALFITVNGQMHASFGKTFFENRCGLSRTGKDIMAYIEVGDELDNAEMLDLFKSTRDRLVKGEAASDFKEELVTAFTANEDANPLHEEEQRRRREKESEKIDEEISDLMEDFVSRQPDLDLLPAGDHTVPGQSQSDEYSAPDVPTRLEMIVAERKDGFEVFDPNNESHPTDDDGNYRLEIPVNRDYATAKLHLNAKNGYLAGSDGGSLNVEPDWAMKTSMLKDGVVAITVPVPEEARPGLTKTVNVSVSRPALAPLEEKFTIQYVEAEETTNDTNNVTTTSSSRGQQVSIPAYNPVEEGDEEWERLNFDEETPIRIDPPTSDSPMTVNVNMDCIYLDSFLAEHAFTSEGKELIEKEWILGLIIDALYHYTGYDEDDEYDNPAREAERAVKNTASTKLIWRFDEDDIESYTS